MKTGFFALRAAVLAGIFGMVAGCRPSTNGEASRARAELVDPDTPEVVGVRAAGEAAAKKLAAALLPELQAAMGAVGVEGAIGFCHNKVLPLARGSYADQSRIMEVNRTSFRVRNPDNAPDPAERQALEYVQERIDAGEQIPPVLVQRLGPAENPAEWRVYRPLTVMPLCLACHGDSDSFSPELSEALVQQYPQDRATGYEDGEWRGLIRVSVRPEEGG